MVACRSSPSSEPDRWPSGAVTLVTTHVLSPRTNMSPSPKTRAVSHNSVLPPGKKMVIWRGTTPRFRPPWRYGSGVDTAEGKAVRCCEQPTPRRATEAASVRRGRQRLARGDSARARRPRRRAGARRRGDDLERGGSSTSPDSDARATMRRRASRRSTPSRSSLRATLRSRPRAMAPVIVVLLS